MHPTDDARGWNDVGSAGFAVDDPEVLASSTFGEVPVADDGDWAPLYEAAVEVCRLPVSEVIRALDGDLIRWRVARGPVAPELELWLPDVCQLPGACC